MRTIALLTAVLFGCATARQPTPEPPAVAGRVALAEPELELWMEGTRSIDPEESARALEASRAALAEAVADRGLDGVPDPEQLLVVRARAIKRTDERRSAQVWSAVGIVVVAVALVVTAILLSRSGSRSSGTGKVHPVAVPTGGGRVPVRGAYPVPRVYAPPPPVGVYLGFGVAVPVGPVPAPPGAEATDAHLASRGWFAGDEVEMTVELADPGTGAVSWSRTLREGVDPADPAALSAMLDRALESLPFGRRVTHAG
jgi:hypothetical protein